MVLMQSFHLLTVVGLVALQLAAAELQFSPVSLASHRLPVNVRPLEYDIHMELPDWESYSGRVNITIEFLKTFKKWSNLASLDQMVSIDNVRLELVRRGTKRVEIMSLERDQANQMIRLRLAEKQKAGAVCTLSFEFRGKLTRTDMRGLYVSTSESGAKAIVTQFQPSDARTVLPCFDEPRFKVPFKLSLKHLSSLTAYSTMKKISMVQYTPKLALSKFAATPKMPIHMFSFTVGDFDEPLSGTAEVPGQLYITVQIITERGKRAYGELALQVVKRSIPHMMYYLDYKFPLQKMDIVAIADHDKDNTESWGLAFIRDDLVLFDPDRTRPDAQITLAVNVAHVIVHQWFANLVTASWWLHLWITEGIASNLAFESVASVIYEIESPYFVRMASLSSQIEADQTGLMHPLAPADSKMATSNDSYTLFDNLEFMKSGSVNQMLLEVTSPEVYKSILRKIVRRHAYGSIDLNDYLTIVKEAVEEDKSVLEHTNFDDIRRLILSWTRQSGFPLINVKSTADLGQLRVSLESFHEAMQRADSSEPGPARRATELNVVTTCGSALTGHSRVISAPYTTQATEEELHPLLGFVKCVKPTLATFYRVRYDDDLLLKFSTIFQIDRSLLEPMERLQLLDDANHLVKAKLISADAFKKLLDLYAGEEHFGVLVQMLTANQTLATLKPTDGNRSLANEAFERLYKKYQFKAAVRETLLEQRARTVIYKALIAQGYEPAIQGALRRFDEGITGLKIFLREPVYDAVVLYGSEEQAKVLLTTLKHMPFYDEELRLATALSQSKYPQVLVRLRSLLKSTSLNQRAVQPLLTSIATSLQSLLYDRL